MNNELPNESIQNQITEIIENRLKPIRDELEKKGYKDISTKQLSNIEHCAVNIFETSLWNIDFAITAIEVVSSMEFEKAKKKLLKDFEIFYSRDEKEFRMWIQGISAWLKYLKNANKLDIYKTEKEKEEEKKPPPSVEDLKNLFNQKRE